MDSVQGTRALPRVGFPIRKSSDQSLFSSSPRLIAAVHVLHRLLVPRHPPCALILLSVENTTYHYAVFKVRGPRARREQDRPGPTCGPIGRDAWKRPSLKTEQYGNRPRGGRRRPSVDIVLGVPLPPTEVCGDPGKSRPGEPGRSTSGEGRLRHPKAPYP